MKLQCKTSTVLNALAVVFVALLVAFLFNLWGKPPELQHPPLVDLSFVSPATVRISAEELLRTGEDASEFECYICHEQDKPMQLKFDAEHNVIVPEEHDNIVMGHGRHNRNNNCFNCHDEQNLELLQTRDGSELKISESAELCGSCHGPTYRDWLAGVHGRTGGFWDTTLGEKHRQTCVACHDPHNPKFPGRQPAPAPHSIHPVAAPTKAKDH